MCAFFGGEEGVNPYCLGEKVGDKLACYGGIMNQN